MSFRQTLDRALHIWGPVVAVMILIFIASAQPKHSPAAPPGTVYFSGAMPVFNGDWDALIKKSAHVLIYGVLALVSLRALLLTGTPLPQAAYLAILVALSYALTDELHQAFVAGRHASVLDLGFDYVGATTASLAARFYHTRRARAPHPHPARCRS